MSRPSNLEHRPQTGGPIAVTTAFRLLANRHQLAATSDTTIVLPAGVTALGRAKITNLTTEMAQALQPEWATHLPDPLAVMQSVIDALGPPRPATLARLPRLNPSVRVPDLLPITDFTPLPLPPTPMLVCIFPGCREQMRTGQPQRMYRHVLSAHYTPRLGRDCLMDLTVCFPHPRLYVLEHPRAANDDDDRLNVWGGQLEFDEMQLAFV